ncbi:MAG: N-acetyltransferase [Dehalococcoidia bacterium]|nr:N-acetyltransferase [Dehalococcoidia bacterium]
MNGNYKIRLATEADAEGMLAIYTSIVLETAISFELDPPSVDEFQSRIRSTLTRTPWLVCEIDGEVAGYAYAGSLRTRAAYQWSVEVTVYVNANYRRLGVGSAVYTSLFNCLRFQGYWNAYAAITLPNAGSVGLHEGMGFFRIGTYYNVGYKFGTWHDVGWWQSELGLLPQEPVTPVLLPNMRDTDEFQERISTGLASLRL